MEADQFVKHFADQFDETDASEFRLDTIFRNIEEWSSIIALSIIAMVDEEYGVSIKGDDVRTSNTIQDLYEIVKSRL
ncbi:MAG: acyl carrier protein [Bacteroidetes bacterium]|nr:acyl carrier protein [Bacteroidota bacterium]